MYTAILAALDLHDELIQLNISFSASNVRHQAHDTVMNPKTRPTVIESSVGWTIPTINIYRALPSKSYYDLRINFHSFAYIGEWMNTYEDDIIQLPVRNVYSVALPKGKYQWT